MKKVLIVMVCLILAAILVVGVGLLSIYISPKSDPRYVAHQGYSDKYLGNGEEAFLAASKMGFYGIETDIRETKDGVFVCNHDKTVKFADGDEKTVSDSTLAELQKPLKNGKTEGEAYLCTFERYLEICREGNKVAIIELKEICDEGKLTRLLTIVDTIYDRRKVEIIAFDYGNLERTRAIDPTITLEYLSETKKDPNFRRCLEDGIAIDVKQSILTKKLVKEFHEKGLKVNVWTLNKERDLAIVRAKQVDLVTTNLFTEE